MKSLVANILIGRILLVPLDHDDNGSWLVCAIDVNYLRVGRFNREATVAEIRLYSPHLEAPAVLVLECLSLAILLISSEVFRGLVITNTKHVLLPELV